MVLLKIRLSENAALKEARLTEAEAELVRSRAACARLEQVLFLVFFVFVVCFSYVKSYPFVCPGK